MGRQVPAGCLVYDQIDLFMPAGSINRVVGESYTTLGLNTFVNNILVTWPLADGTFVADSSISAGTVYFNQITGSPGFYTVRFFPDRTGFWRLIFREATLGEEVILSYDVIHARSGPGELNASFVPYDGR
jgi:hypothetical protein